MRPVHVLMKPSSGNCNMRCDYCFYYDTMEKRERASFGYMSIETLEKVIQKTLSSAVGSYSITFQGGEPTLSGLAFYKKVVEFEKKYNINCVDQFDIQRLDEKINSDFATNVMIDYNVVYQWMNQFLPEEKKYSIEINAKSI